MIVRYQTPHRHATEKFCNRVALPYCIPSTWYEECVGARNTSYLCGIHRCNCYTLIDAILLIYLPFALDYESEGRTFESFRARHCYPIKSTPFAALRGEPLPRSDDLEAHGMRAGAFPLNEQRCAARADPFKNEKGGGGALEIPPLLTPPTRHPPVSGDGTRSSHLHTDLLGRSRGRAAVAVSWGTGAAGMAAAVSPLQPPRRQGKNMKVSPGLSTVADRPAWGGSQTAYIEPSKPQQNDYSERVA